MRLRPKCSRNCKRFGFVLGWSIFRTVFKSR